MQVTVWKNGEKVAIVTYPTSLWCHDGLPYAVKHAISGYVNDLHKNTSYQRNPSYPKYTWECKHE